MPMSSYPGGFAAGVMIRGVPLIQTHPGKVFWVDNSTAGSGDTYRTGSDGNKGTFDAPFATLDYAIGQCRANKGDIIFIKPGHVETLTATSVAVDVAGIAIVGLGRGSMRPTFNANATASVFPISAANVLVHNLLFTGGIDAVVSMVTVSAADVALSNCEIRDVTGQMVLGVLTTASADRMKIHDFQYTGDTAAGGGAAIALVGGTDIVIEDFDISGNFSVAGIDVRTTATTRLRVRRGKIRNALNSATPLGIVDTITASTGTMGPELFIELLSASSNAANITEAITGATFTYDGGGTVAGLVGNGIRVVNLAGEAGMIINKTASTDA
jgi:hypothetical protein